MANKTTWFNEFTLLGLTDNAKSQIILFVFFMLVYIITCLGNSLMVITITLSTTLHTPMYFFLRNLSVVDICYTTSTVPKLLSDFLMDTKQISFFGCVAQCYFFFLLGGIEHFLLTIMAYDRYVAICHPLRYNTIVTSKVCWGLVLGCWFGGFSSVLLPVILISKLPFCQSHDINHFFCDVSPIIQLACSDIEQLEMFIFFTAIIVILGSFSVIVMSYLWILVTILEIKTSTGKKKAFSTCSSHLTAIFIYFGTIIFMYIRPKSKSNLNMDKQASVFYSVVTPTLNPLIYTLRNNEFKISLKGLFRRFISS
ncbi:unnamed protein product [Staurois parvus]|uniref:G-protein coupled receptors family 1 profile domain-containing protein n=1 Tax=Staurois parvus TaxID=386267 RepID=A0ABN9F513_9NEOB|nr:unnamed protein product [Staurois parvus]